MDLKEFVSQTLQQIVAGVADAQKATVAGEINPKIWQRGDAAKLKIVESNAGKWIHLVDFDVAVAVFEGTATHGGIGLVVGPVALGSKGQSKDESSTISRIKFSVPIALPEGPAA